MSWSVIGNKPERCGIGLMSGTSCDGVDAAVVRIRGTGPGLEAELVGFTTVPYAAELRDRLLSSDMDARQIALLNVEVGERLAEAVEAGLEIAREHGVEVDFVASHGHTIAHYPPGTLAHGHGTLQIGEPAVIAERTGLPVVSDFRQRDMAAGGQGAPLVPYADWLLFARDDATVATLNIGGIANFTVVTPELDGVFAFDTGPGNMVIDGAVRLVTDGQEPCDWDGAMAARGRVIDELFDRLVGHAYFARTPPKSTGREEFGCEAYLSPALEGLAKCVPDDIVATVTAVAAQTIVDAYRCFIEPHGAVAQVIVSGGGARNSALMRLLREGFADTPVALTDEYGIPSDAREAVAFAILGNETLCGAPANIPTATGARHRAVLGKITPP